MEGSNLSSIGEIMRENMKDHEMKIPVLKTVLKVPNANQNVKDAMAYFLSLEGKELIWRPEYEKVSNWLENTQGRGLFMYGNCGLGKSILGRYVIPGLLLHYCRKVVRVFDTKEMNESLDEVLKMHLVSLDDVGTEDISNKYGNRRMAFAEIMDEAEKKSRVIIISTNLISKEQIEAKYGTRVYDRIISTTERIKFTGKSLRK